MNPQQLDLFLDSREVMRVNDLVAALSAHDSERAAQGLACLRAEVPGQPDLPAFESLYAFLEMTRQIDFSGPNSAALEAIVELLDRRIVPAAGVLGAAARDFFQGFWLQLARAANHPFDRDRPQCHAAGLFLRAQAYDAVEAVASGIVDAQTEPAVLRWRALARYHLGGLPAARWQIFSLAWYAADSFPDFLGELRDAQLDQDWLGFQAAVEELEVEWFPAWCLLQQPAVAAEIGSQLPPASEQAAASIPAMQACLLLIRIVALEKQGLSSALVEQRARLKAVDAGFFVDYMCSRELPPRPQPAHQHARR